MKVSCLGPNESYSVLAAVTLCPDAEVVSCNSFAEVLGALEAGEADGAILPVRNRITGTIVKNFDLISKVNGIMGVRECILPIDHRLVTKGTIPYSEITRVCSHVQALGQCSAFLERNFPDAELVVTRSTAESLSLLDERTAGIVGAHVSGQDIVLSESNIADDVHNNTRFLLFEKRQNPPDGSKYILFSALCEQSKGALCGLLNVFAKADMNLDCIESRPIRGLDGVYRFFMTYEGNIGSKRVQEAFREAERQGAKIRIVGAYD